VVIGAIGVVYMKSYRKASMLVLSSKGGVMTQCIRFTRSSDPKLMCDIFGGPKLSGRAVGH
jgi:hypothetical protein